MSKFAYGNFCVAPSLGQVLRMQSTTECLRYQDCRLICFSSFIWLHDCLCVSA